MNPPGDGQIDQEQRDEIADLFTTYGGQVWRAVLAASGGRPDVADDVTAEAFAEYIRRRDGVRDPLAYVFRVAYRLAAKELRRERQQVALAAGADPHTAPVVASVLTGELTEALLGISIEQRFVVVLHYFLDLPVSEIARLTGSSTTAVKVRLHRARRQLRSALPNWEATDA
jgi:RNA polymerase sigma-70 factor (ECF subfamily)